MPIRIGAVSLALSMAFGSAGASLERPSAQGPSGTTSSSKRMADGKQWTTRNLDVNTVPSHCYDDADVNCRQYGRLYTWESAQRGCQSLGEGWRLPTSDEWRQMARQYGVMLEDANETGESAAKALFTGGSSGFNALLGGSRSPGGQYERMAAHGLYWTASESGPATAWLYHFGKLGLNRSSGLQKEWGFSVRCVRE